MVLDTLTSSDRVELLELYARSVMLLDLGRCTEWADLFAPDAVVRCADARDPDARDPCAIQQFQGHDELLTLGRRLMSGEFDIALGSVAPPLRCRHLLSNITLFGEGPHHASAFAYVTVISIGGIEPPRWMASGYCDRLRKCPAGWRFENRRFDADGGAIAAFCAKQSLIAPTVTS
jgi:hypothetical protein